MRGHYQQDKFRTLIQQAAPILREKQNNIRIAEIRSGRQSETQGKMQEAYRQYYLSATKEGERNLHRAIFEQNSSYLAGRDPYFEPLYVKPPSSAGGKGVAKGKKKK